MSGKRPFGDGRLTSENEAKGLAMDTPGQRIERIVDVGDTAMEAIAPVVARLVGT